jgi:ABC-type Fe3+/spermidine/putrescine transport system ATPase subunit
MSEAAFPLSICNLTHRYDKNDDDVLYNINLALEPGEFMAILGPSGCGKSTLLRAIAGLVTPDYGCIRINGEVVVASGREKVPAESREIGMVFQDYALFPYMNVRENISFGLKHQKSKMNKVEQEARVQQLLELIEMQAFANRMPSELSGGQQQRVALARALAKKPKLLLLDEPFANVDTNLRQCLGEQLQMLVKQEGVSVLMVTHDRQEAFALADKVAILDNCLGSAKIVQCDTPEHIYQQPANQCAAELSGPVLLLDVEAEGLKAKTSLGEITLLNPSKGNGKIVVRPEMAKFKQVANGNAKVIARSYQGRNYRILCATEYGNVLAESDDPTPPALGTQGQLNIDAPCWVIN